VTDDQSVQLEPAPNTITLRNSENEVLRINADGSIDWKGERLTTAPEVGRALAMFIAEHMPQPWTTLDGYQRDAMTYAVGDQTATLLYGACGLAGETGEVCDKIKKIVRDDAGVVSPEKLEALKLELGDCLWYLARIAQILGLPLARVADANLMKLLDRHQRNTLQGSGDNR
jgi:NTP pyrophosphatase (non-canonical NTP hydrolase)